MYPDLQSRFGNCEWNTVIVEIEAEVVPAATLVISIYLSLMH